MNIRSIFLILVTFILVFVEIVSVSSGLWLIGNVNIIVIACLVLAAKDKENYAIALVVLGSLLVDLVAYRAIGVQLFIFVAAMLLSTLILKTFGFLDSRRMSVKIMVSFLLYLLMYLIFLFTRGGINPLQILVVTGVNALLILFSITIFTRQKTTHHVLKF